MVEATATRMLLDQHGSVDWTLPLILSTLAGLSTCVGAAVVFSFGKNNKPNHRHMAFSLCLAGSVMMTVCLLSILPECFENYASMTTADLGARCLSLLIGCVLYFGLSKCAFPEPEEVISLGLEQQQQVLPLTQRQETELSSSTTTTTTNSTPTKSNQFRTTLTVQRKRPLSTPPSSSPLLSDAQQGHPRQDTSDPKSNKRACLWNDFSLRGNDLNDSEARRAWRLSLVLFVSLMVHNFPEGLAVAVSTMHNVQLGWTTALAIAFHNIPEGIAVAIPCLAARPDAPWLAFGLASVSGLAEPLGAAVALVLFDPHRGLALEIVLAFVAGVMMMVAVLDLFPEAYRHMKGEKKLPGIAGTIAGMVIMLVSDAYLDA